MLRRDTHWSSSQYFQRAYAPSFFPNVRTLALPFDNGNLISQTRATVAGDKQVLVFDIGQVHGPSVPGCDGRYSETPTHTLRCHEDRVKRIVTEDSPDVFLTVSEVRYTGLLLLHTLTLLPRMELFVNTTFERLIHVVLDARLPWCRSTLNCHP